MSDTRVARLERAMAAWQELTEALEPNDLPPETLMDLAKAAFDLGTSLTARAVLAGAELPELPEEEAGDE